MAGDLLSIWLVQTRHTAETGRWQQLGQRRQILLQPRGCRVDDVGHPAGQCQLIPGNRLGTEHRVIDAPQPHADDQDHRQAQRLHDRRKTFLRVERHAPAACTFHQGEIGLPRQNRPYHLNQTLGAQLDTGFASGDMRRDSRREGERLTVA